MASRSRSSASRSRRSASELSLRGGDGGDDGVVGSEEDIANAKSGFGILHLQTNKPPTATSGRRKENIIIKRSYYYFSFLFSFKYEKDTLYLHLYNLPLILKNLSNRINIRK